MSFNQYKKIETRAFQWGALLGFLGGIAFSAFLALLFVVSIGSL